MINRNAEIVGLILTEIFTRTAVHSGSIRCLIVPTSGGILEALKNIYEATELLVEIKGR